jgi:hypothetical protein
MNCDSNQTIKPDLSDKLTSHSLKITLKNISEEHKFSLLLFFKSEIFSAQHIDIFYVTSCNSQLNFSLGCFSILSEREKVYSQNEKGPEQKNILTTVKIIKIFGPTTVHKFFFLFSLFSFFQQFNVSHDGHSHNEIIIERTPIRAIQINYT